MKRIAIFQADHPLQVHTLNVIKGLERAGYQVDLFLLNCRNEFAKPEGIKGQIYDLSDKNIFWAQYQGRHNRLAKAFSYFISAPLSDSDHNLLTKSVINETKAILDRSTYKCYFGIEKLGLVWAGIISGYTSVPVIYYSLELYTTKAMLNSSFKGFRLLKAIRFLALRNYERKYHRTAHATIIQDKNRAQEIYRYNKVPRMHSLFMPVTLIEEPIIPKSRYLRDLYGITDDKVVLLQLGIIGKNRLVEEVSDAARSFLSNWVLVFHGPVYDKNILLKIKQNNNRVIVSDKLVSPEDLNKLVNSADIGLCFYPNRNANDYHTGFSSEKLTRYLQYGIPVITPNYPTFEQSVGVTGAGVCIQDMSHLSQAVSTITADFKSYQQNAYAAYLQFFEFYSQFKKVVELVNNIR